MDFNVLIKISSILEIRVHYNFVLECLGYENAYKWFELGQWCEELENPQILNFSVYVICFENNKFMLIVYELR